MASRTVRRMGASLTAARQLRTLSGRSFNSGPCGGSCAVGRIAALEGFERRRVDGLDRDVAEQLHPREPGPVVVVAVDGERGARVGVAAAAMRAGSSPGRRLGLSSIALTIVSPTRANVTGCTRG